MSSCTNSFVPPDTEKTPHKMEIHGDIRIDNYYWMRLTDEQKSAKKYDNQTQKVVDYISSEDKYLKNSLEHTKPLQKTLFDEMVGRIKKTDMSVAVADSLSKKALEKKITKVYFDRGRYKYHGRIKTFAETLRKGGLIF